MWAAGYGPLKCFLLAHLHVLSFFSTFFFSLSLLISILSIICPFQLRVRFVNFHMLAKTWLAHSSSLPASAQAASHRSKQRQHISLLGCLDPAWLLQWGRGGNCTFTLPEWLTPFAGAPLSKAQLNTLLCLIKQIQNYFICDLRPL